MKLTKILSYDVNKVDDFYYCINEDGFVVRIDDPNADGFEVVENSMTEEESAKEKEIQTYYRIIHDSGLLDEGWVFTFLTDDFLQIIKPSDNNLVEAVFGLVLTKYDILVMKMSQATEIPVGLIRAIEKNEKYRFTVVSKYDAFSSDHFWDTSDLPMRDQDESV